MHSILRNGTDSMRTMLQQAPRHLEPHPLTDYTVDVDVILKLYDLRPGDRMRKSERLAVRRVQRD
jgi:hypothetical protein